MPQIYFSSFYIKNWLKLKLLVKYVDLQKNTSFTNTISKTKTLDLLVIEYIFYYSVSE